MTNDDLDLLKIELECEKFRLMSYQLDDLLEEYNKLMELRANIQFKFFNKYIILIDIFVAYRHIIYCYWLAL